MARSWPLLSGNAELRRQRSDHFVDNRLMRLLARLHRNICRGVKRLALRQEGLDLRSERALGAPLGAPEQHIEIGLEPHRNAFCCDQSARIGVHHSPSTGRQHLWASFEQPRNHPCLTLAELRLTM